MNCCPFCHKALVSIKNLVLGSRITCKNSDCYITGYSRFIANINEVNNVVYYLIAIEIDGEVYEVISRQDFSTTTILHNLTGYELVFRINQFISLPQNNIPEYYANLVQRALQLIAFQ